MNLQDERGYQLPHFRLREMLGLDPGRLPDNSDTLLLEVDGISIAVFTRLQAKSIHPESTRPHRVYAGCPTCGKYVPAGRLRQHSRSHKA